MRIEADTVDEYIDKLPEDRQKVISDLRTVLQNNLSKDFKECLSYGMIGFVVPHEIYPNGYHCDPKLPLPFINLASQKNYVALYHMGVYAQPDLLEWFQQEYKERVPHKLDMGKSCIRFKKMDQIPLDLVGELAQKMNAQQWIELYEKSRQK
jgi:uncharacterized protein YdhG (YjbR/CyaY superfamily)